ncbi:hypothetical protein SAMN05878443_0323 [Carnobacterium alterfunditum]|uniref:Uncharacterized protein n=1 Tax=Carnobacterium alterfunditum TaxID=28230 RepID=A0A1N6F0M0_9LACT|nr:hypothetical protein [Carnobacterium alterfunditum]SIN88848.1 hypothetical protein SAMN05878443_0323 [Carnobacterium alterfunditum]
MINSTAKRKIRTATLVVFILCSLAFLFSTGGDSSVFSVFIISIYAGLVVAAVFYVLLSIFKYVVTLISGWLNNDKKRT